MADESKSAETETLLPAAAAHAAAESAHATAHALAAAPLAGSTSAASESALPTPAAVAGGAFVDMAQWPGQVHSASRGIDPQTLVVRLQGWLPIEGSIQPSPPSAMMGVSGMQAALTNIRALSYAMLAYALFYLAMAQGKWYKAEVLDDELEFKLGRDLKIRSSYNQRFVFIGLPIVFSAALGGVYEAIWKRNEAKADKPRAADGEASRASRPGIFALLQSVMHYKFRPLGQYAPWLTIGEASLLFLWVAAMGSQCWQRVMSHGNHFHDRNAHCPNDPSLWCSILTGAPSPTPAQYRLKVIAVSMGLVCTSHFAVILVPVSRDSKIWSALGVPFERAVLYHAIAGHLAFAALFMHAFLFIVFWVWWDGWSHAVHESIHVDTHGDVDTRMGWMAALCALPMWITSANYVRRRWYSLFKLSHWLFIGVFVFSVMHSAPNALYFLGGLALYTLHIMSRLQSWKRWRYWNRWRSPETKASPTSLVHALTKDSYTRLVLRNPKAESARGGSFVYISVPAALGTDEAHAITVALRGAPPSSSPVKVRALPEEDVFTIYVKDVGSWTKALRQVAKGAEATAGPGSLLVDVDGFYNQVNSFSSMMHEGVSRVVVFAGGSGLTSFMGFIQDWCVAAAEGAHVPQIHLAWCCRYMSEMELVGEALPSLLARAGHVKDTHFKISLYCSKVDKSDGPLDVTWPLDSMAYACSRTKEHVIGKDATSASLNYSVRVIIAGLAAYGGFLLGMYEVNRRGLMDTFHEGAIIFVLMVICIVSALVVYGWLTSLVQACWRNDAGSSQIDESSNEESKADLESTTMGGAVTYEVERGRLPTTKLLTEEADLAKKTTGVHSVKVLASGPNSLVDKVLADARTIDWKLFDTQTFSFEF